ncbi:MAG: nucleoside kinase, partial [Bacteroidaceae bacterium]|nr:nucleoside kinase [Bacteroidaceae bacterium]
MKQVVQIRCKNNNKIKSISIGSTLLDIFREFNLEMDYGPISAKVNNKVEGLHYRVYHNKDVEFLDLHSPSGLRTYTRSLF